MIRIERFALGMLGTNCYLAGREKETVIVDPADSPDYLTGHIEREKYLPTAILLTHGHFDHMMGVKELAGTYDIPVYAHEAEREILEDAAKNLSSGFGRAYTLSDITYVKEGEILHLAGMDFEVIHTPGHTCGSCCYYIKDEHVLFSGDTLFQASIGRTDFPTGSEPGLVRSIREKLFTLPEETKVYPGHEGETTIQEEKLYNPCV